MADFSESISALCGSIEGISQLCQTILSVNSGANALESVGNLGSITEEVCLLLDHWIERASAREVTDSFLRVRLDLQDMHKIGMCFRMVSTLTAVNTSGMESAMMAGFIRDLRAMPDQIDSGVDEVLSRLSRVGEVSRTAVDAAQLGLVALGKARSMLVAQSDISYGVVQQTLQAQAAIEDNANRFIDHSHAQTKSLVSGFQYSDFFAQQLEHIVDMLGHEGEFGPAVLHLAAHQIEALAKHGNEVVSEIDSALRAQDRAMARFYTSFSAQSQITATGNTQQRGIFESVLTSRERALPAIAEAVSASERVQTEVTLCNESFAKLVEMSGVIDVAAMNARIRASRSGTAQQAMAMLSATVIENANECRQILSGCSKGLNRVASVQDPESLRMLVTTVDRFSSALQACEDGLFASEQRASRLDAASADVGGLIKDAAAMLHTCSQISLRVKGVLKKLSDVGRQINAGVEKPLVWPDMQPIYDTYTMQSERDTHDLLIGRPLTTAAPVTASAAAFDDIFF